MSLYAICLENLVQLLYEAAHVHFAFDFAYLLDLHLVQLLDSPEPVDVRRVLQRPPVLNRQSVVIQLEALLHLLKLRLRQRERINLLGLNLVHQKQLLPVPLVQRVVLRVQHLDRHLREKFVADERPVLPEGPHRNPEQRLLLRRPLVVRLAGWLQVVRVLGLQLQARSVRKVERDVVPPDLVVRIPV